MDDNYHFNPKLSSIFYSTKILRKPISGIVSGYHELPYILIAPDEENPLHSVEINGTINVSPKFILTPAQLSETFGDVFDPETFDREIQGRLFSFAYAHKKNVKVENAYITIKNFEKNPDEHIGNILDSLYMKEDVKTGLIFGPKFKYYPISIDRYINEIIDREFNI